MKNIEIINLNKSYGDIKVLDDFNCIFEYKKTNVIMGSSGIGKTTLINILLGIEDKDSGKIVGMNKNISPIFQENRLLESYSVYENIEYVIDEIDRDTIDVGLERVGLAGKGSEKIGNLSGGMKRRVEILKAVLKESDIYIFDEPFKEMDEEMYIRVLEYVSEVLRDKTVIFSTHKRDEAEYFDGKVLHMK